MHGLNSYAHDWRPVAELLVAHGRRVLVPYARSRGPDPLTAHAELTAYRAMPAPDLSRYPKVRTTVLVGEHTEPHFDPRARAIVAGLPDARLVMLPGHGHLAHSADPAMLAEVLFAA